MREMKLQNTLEDALTDAIVSVCRERLTCQHSLKIQGLVNVIVDDSVHILQLDKVCTRHSGPVNLCDGTEKSVERRLAKGVPATGQKRAMSMCATVPGVPRKAVPYNNSVGASPMTTRRGISGRQIVPRGGCSQSASTLHQQVLGSSVERFRRQRASVTAHNSRRCNICVDDDIGDESVDTSCHVNQHLDKDRANGERLQRQLPEADAVIIDLSDSDDDIDTHSSVRSQLDSVQVEQGSVKAEQGSVKAEQGSVKAEQGSVKSGNGSVRTGRGSVRSGSVKSGHEEENFPNCSLGPTSFETFSHPADCDSFIDYPPLSETGGDTRAVASETGFDSFDGNNNCSNETDSSAARVSRDNPIVEGSEYWLEDSDVVKSEQLIAAVNEMNELNHWLPAAAVESSCAVAGSDVESGGSGFHDTDSDPDYDPCSEEDHDPDFGAKTKRSSADHKSLKRARTSSFNCQFKSCNKSYPKKSSLDRHQRSVHGCIFGATCEVTFRCCVENCNKVFRRSCLLQKHLSDAHGYISEPPKLNEF